MKTTRTGDKVPPRAVIYVRISQDRTGANLGVDRQREDCEALAKRNGWNVVETYIDNDVSAYSGKKRPAYRQMLSDLETGIATVVVAWHTDRLHRSPVELEEYIDVSERRGVTTHTVQAGTVDLSTPSGRMTARILGAVARQESEHKGERVRRAALQRATDGKYNGGIRPFGFRLPTEDEAPAGTDDGPAPALVHVPEEAEAIRTCTDMILSGATLNSVVRWLADKGLTTTRGHKWGTTETRDMLMRARLAGIAVYKGDELGAGRWEPIVPEEKWRAVVALLTDPSRRTSPGATPKWLGSLIYRCGIKDCTLTTYVTQSGGRRHPSYRCQSGHGGGRRADKVDKLVQDVVIERLSRADAVDLLLPGPGDVNVGELLAESATVRQKLSELTGLYNDGVIDGGHVAEGSKTNHARLEGIRQQLARAATRDPLAGLVGVPNPRKAWEGLELEQKRAVLRTLVEVTIRPQRPGRMPDGSYFDPDAIEITWKRGAKVLASPPHPSA